MKKKLYYPFWSLLFFAAFFIEGCKKPSTEECHDNEGLYKSAKYPIGVAVNFEDQFDPRYREIVNTQFNSITPGNLFKFENLQPFQDHFEWSQADQLLDYCNRYNKRLHGHTLVWHQQLPQWVHSFNGNKEEWENIYKNHIQTVVKHFKGKVKGWDVVNEAFNEDGTLRNTIWLQKIGSSYIEKAFRYAREADPEALLFYNDFGLEYNFNKRQAVLKCLESLKNRGVKVDGIGLQTHIFNEFPENEQIQQSIQECSEKGYHIHLSEIDISVNLFGKNDHPDEAVFLRQANKLAAVVRAYNLIPQNQQYGLTFWGVSDRDSWIRYYFNRMDYPLLFDEYYQPKPAYCKLKQTL